MILAINGQDSTQLRINRADQVQKQMMQMGTVEVLLRNRRLRDKVEYETLGHVLQWMAAVRTKQKNSLISPTSRKTVRKKGGKCMHSLTSLRG